MKIKEVILIFCMMLLVLPGVLADTNVSLNYVYNGTDWIPWLSTADGKPKMDLNLLNITAGDLIVDTNTLYVNSTNNRVGIGTASPTDALTILNSGGPQIRLGGSSSDAGIYIGAVDEGSEENEGIFGFGVDFTDSGGVITSWIARSTSAGILRVDGGELNYYANTGLTPGNTFSPTAYFTIQSDGDIGIGTATPTQKLDVVGDVNITGDLVLGSGTIRYNDSEAKYYYYNTTNWAVIGEGGDFHNYVYDGSSWLPMLSDADGVQKVFMNNSEGGYWGVSGSDYYYNGGNVGIGTSTPGSLLHLYGTGNLLNVSNANSSILYVSGDSGRVGVGTTAPTAKLDVQGDVNIYLD